MGWIFKPVLLAACMLSPACQQGAIGSPDSLVGAQDLPSKALLEQEIIIISRLGGENADEILNIELHPDDAVKVSHSRQIQGSADRDVLSEEDLRLSSAAGDAARQKLWRLRPANDAPAQNTVPLGCHYIYDAGEDVQVAFVRMEADYRLEIFSLPYPENCRSRSWTEARALVDQVLQSFPRSKVASAFPPGKYEPVGTYTP